MTVSVGVLQQLAVTAITGKTGAADRVYDPRTWPTTLDEMPIILVDTPQERKTGEGRSGGPAFTCVATLRIVGRVYAKAQTGDAGALAAMAAAQLLQRQIEVALVNDHDLKLVVQEYAAVRVKTQVSKDGEVVFGEVVMEFDLEFYQGPEDFAPIDADPILEMAVFLDLVNVFSPTGDFPDPPFPGAVQPAPRTSGPDGRVEAALVIILPADVPDGELDFEDGRQSGLHPAI